MGKGRIRRNAKVDVLRKPVYPSFGTYGGIE
jgi:hypothetical protein